MERKDYMKRAMAILAAILAAACAATQATAQDYLATTRWVAAIAEMAGIGPVANFAPAELSHPPEYELKPGDLLRLAKAKAVFAAGYETAMMKKINDALKSGGSSFEVVTVQTDNSIEVLSRETLKIARKFGTMAKRDEAMRAYEGLIESIRGELKANGTFEKDAFVHLFQVPLAKDLGFNVVGTFGPAPASPAQIAEIAKAKPFIIIDNVHNPVAKPLLEASPLSVYASFLNFPGRLGTSSIADVVSHNRKVLAEAKAFGK